MPLSRIPIYDFNTNIFDLWDKKWFLLTAGDFKTGQFNTMTISWGSMGIMWNKPFVQVVVRPTRHTFGFMEKYQTFSLSAFAETFRPALKLLGTRSGRDGDKIAEAGLTPMAGNRIAAPAFREAELVFECEKIYQSDFNPEQFLDPNIENNYPKRDYHRIYFGMIKGIFGSDQYSDR